MDSTSAAILTASASAGALIGDYVSIYSIGTQTEMFKNRVPGGLGAGLNLATNSMNCLCRLRLQLAPIQLLGKLFPLIILMSPCKV